MAATAILLPPTPTPSDYLRFVSPTLSLPKDTSSPIPVGLLACQRDPLLRKLFTQIISCTVAQTQPVSNVQRKSKKDTQKSQAAQSTLLEVITHDTVLFPEGGGQPHDTGVIHTEDGKQWEVIDVKRHGGHAVHYIKIDKDTTPNIDDALRSLAGTVSVELDDKGYERRLDHMCMHTSQHLLSAVLENTLKLPTLSWALTTYPTPSYVEIPRPISPAEILQVQSECNRYVYEGRKVHIEVEELDKGKEKKVETTESGRSIGKGLPEDYTGGVHRVVVIDGVDRNPCCGTHLPSLSNLQLFLLPNLDSVTRSTTGTSTSSARLYFLCGPRLLTHLTTTHTLLSSTSSIMSCGMPQVPSRVEQVIDERKKSSKRVEELEKELSLYVAKDLLDHMPAPSLWHASTIDGKDVPIPTIPVYRHRSDDSSNPLSFLTSISQTFSSLPNIPKDFLVVFTSSPSAQSSQCTTTLLLFSSQNLEGKVKAVGDELKKRLDVRGGGKGRWSGKWVGVWKEEREGNVVRDILRTAFPPQV
ncbi:Threonyl/alanyl tRNA synthetase [Abortiporus biennis]|nr:Threonyl/alanyl tRNA synthetase [Abortiporus biennis]